MEDKLYKDIPDPSDNITAANVIIRMIDALSFRYRWSLEGLDNDILDFRASSDSMSFKELLAHIHYLINRMYVCFVKETELPETAGDIDEIKKQTLSLLIAIRDNLSNMEDAGLSDCKLKKKDTGEEIPFWYFLNGPLADALTHVGQINLLRRLAKKPALKVNLFRGKAV